jgi:hypothetical protein
MPTRGGRLLAIAILIVTGCGPSAGRAAPATSAAGTPTTIAATTVTATPATEPPVGPGKLGSILLAAGDLPPGFVAARASDTGAESLSLKPCGHAIIASGPGVTSARAVFDDIAGQRRLVQQVLAFDKGDPGALVAQIRQVGEGCRKSGTLAVAALHPLEVGEQVAGVQLSGDGRVIDVAIVRSGPIDVVLVLTSFGGPVPAASLRAVVAAAGTRLAVGTGG